MSTAIACARILFCVPVPGVPPEAASTTASTPATTLGLAKPEPLTVVGRNFRSHERVRVSATLEGRKRTRAVTAGQTGRFQVVFVQLAASRCDAIRVVAVRRSGALVVLKRLPAP